MDFLEEDQFNQIYVSGDVNFIYQGTGQPQFGKLEPGTQHTRPTPQVPGRVLPGDVM